MRYIHYKRFITLVSYQVFYEVQAHYLGIADITELLSAHR